MDKTLTKVQQEQALNIVAEWMRPYLGEWTACGQCEACERLYGPYSCTCPRFGEVPTGKDAADSGLGPMLVPDWDWSGKPTPTVILEGGPADWAIHVADERRYEFRKIGVFAEPYASYALSLYVHD